LIDNTLNNAFNHRNNFTTYLAQFVAGKSQQPRGRQLERRVMQGGGRSWLNADQDDFSKNASC